MPNQVYPMGSMPSYMGVWGVANTSRGAKIAGTDGRVFYVQPNATLAVDNGNTGEDPTCPFLTITAALARCQDNRGDVILVGYNDAWQYGGGSTWNAPIQETVVCTVQGVTILGISPDPIGVPWEPEAAGEIALTIAALGVEVAGFCFQEAAVGGGTETGVYAVWDGATTFGDNPYIHHCHFADSLQTGINLEYSWNSKISDCEFMENTYGIYCDPAGSGFSYGRIDRCYFKDCSTAAISATGGCDHNVVSSCIVWNADAQAAALATNEGVNFTGGDGNVVNDCFFSCVLPAPANGDFDDLNTASATDAWINNHCLNGDTTTNPT